MRLFLWSILWFATSCEEEKYSMPLDYEEARNRLPIQQGKDIRYFYTEGTRLKATLEAPYYREALDTNKQNIVYFDSSLKITFFNANEQQESQLTAQKGIYHHRKGFALATGNVVVSNIKNEKMETEKLFWLKQQDKLSTNAFVKITTDKEILFGDSLVSNTSFTNYKIFKLKGRLEKVNLE